MIPTLENYLTKPAAPQRIEGGLRVQGVHPNNIQPFVSVITVVRNGEKTLRQTIHSVLNQTYRPIEYIIVDGCSTDRTLDIIKSYEERIAYWISEPDQGIYDAMNKGIALASGQWIHLLNADDRYYDHSVLEQAVRTLDESKTNYFTLVRTLPNDRQKQQKFPYQGWQLYILPRLPHPALVVAKQQYEQVGLYDTALKIASDHDFTLRLLNKYPAKFTDTPFVVMSHEGFGSVNIELAFQEFRDVTIRYKFPLLLAWMVYYSKLVRWKLKQKLDR
ncbi:MAG: glycosyltransferase family 2 protein [Cyanophyceae cyanobacterium]